MDFMDYRAIAALFAVVLAWHAAARASMRDHRP
jgi:hypothetical protein